MKRRVHAVVLTFCVAALPAVHAGSLAAEDEQPPGASLAAPSALQYAPPIRSAHQLDAYLQRHAPPSPLDPLSTLGRERFLRSLQFNANGLTTFNYRPLVEELNTRQVEQVLALFGAENQLSRLPGLQAVVGNAAPEGAGTALSPSLDVRMEQLLQTLTDATPQQRTTQLERMYYADPRVSVLAQDCSSVSPAERRELFRATATANFHLDSPQLLGYLSCLLPQMHADGTALPSDNRDLHGALVAQRRFAQANALRAERNLDVAELPVIEGTRQPGARQVMRLHGTSRTTLETLPSEGWRIIAIVHPYCGFSRRATAAIAADPALQDLRERLQLVVPDTQSWPIKQMLAWNEAHPALPMQPMLGSVAWEGIDTDATPAFYLMRDGVLVQRASGWNGSGEELQPLLQRMRQAD